MSDCAALRIFSLASLVRPIALLYDRSSTHRRGRRGQPRSMARVTGRRRARPRFPPPVGASWPARRSARPTTRVASMSPVVPTIGAAGSYRTMASPEAKCAITSPAPGRCASGGRPAGFPRLGRRVAQGTVGRIRPPDLVQVGVPLRIGLGRLHQATAVLLVDRHLLGKQEPGAQPGRLGAEGEHGCHSAGVSDPAGRDHRHRCHRVHDRRHQRQRRHLAPHVPAGLPALGHDDINSDWRRPAAPLRRCRPCAGRSPPASWTCST